MNLTQLTNSVNHINRRIWLPVKPDLPQSNEGYYESSDMNQKLAAAKKWLADRLDLKIVRKFRDEKINQDCNGAHATDDSDYKATMYMYRKMYTGRLT